MPRVRQLIADKLLPPFRGTRCRELLHLHKPGSAHHVVQFYVDESLIIENASYLAAKTLASSDSSVLIGTESHLQQIEDRLALSVLNLDALRESGRYVTLDAAVALSRFMVDGRPHVARFDNSIGDTIRRATQKSANGFVFAFGEIVALLCADNNPDGTIRVEHLWNSLAERHRFSLYCAYPLGSLGNEPDANALMEICAEHALTIPAETSP